MHFVFTLNRATATMYIYTYYHSMPAVQYFYVSCMYLNDFFFTFFFHLINNVYLILTCMYSFHFKCKLLCN